MKLARFFSATMFLLLSACGVSEDAKLPPGDTNTLVFVDWISINHGLGMVVGDLGTIGVTISGLTISADSVTDNSYVGFDNELFTPRLATSDNIQFLGQLDDGQASGFDYTVIFGSSVSNPVIHFSSLASQITFASGVQVTKLSGDPELSVNGNVVTGVTRNGTPNDANGTVRLEGDFTSITFNALWNTCSASCFNDDGITLQLGAYIAN